MADYETDECRSCNAAVIWTQTERGRDMPVDVEPHADGTIELRQRQDAKPLAVVINNPAKRFGKTQLRRSHFVTCPQSGAWRRDRSRS